MAGTYEIWLTTDSGSRIALLDDILGGTFVRVTNGIGAMDIALPASFETALLERDRLIQVWRAFPGGVLSLFRSYFIRKWSLARSGSDLLIQISGPDVNDLMRRRNIINFSRTAESSKSGAIDDVMKEFVDEQCVNDASDPATDFGVRAITNLSIQPDTSAGPALSSSAAWRNLAETLIDLSKSSRAEGTEVFWDVKETATSNTITFEFQTTTGQPGADRISQVTFDEERGNLEESILTLDYTEEASYVYGLGQGSGDARNIQQQYDSDRIDQSIYNRREAVAFASNSETSNAVREAAKERLTQGLPRRLFSGRAIDTVGTRFGRDWGWGDKVTARFLNFEFEAIIRQLIIRLDNNGLETVDARIESEQIIS